MSDDSGQKHKVYCGLVLALLALLIIGCRLYTRTEPLQNDLTFYALIGHEMNEGKWLYSDVNDQKPPGIFVAYAIAERFVGFGPQCMFLLSVLTSLGTLLGVFFAGLWFKSPDKEPNYQAALIAAACWAITSGCMTIEANQPNTECFQNLFKVWAFALLLRFSWKRVEWLPVVLIGLCFFLATMFKQLAIMAPIFLMTVFSIYALGEGSTWRTILKIVGTVAIIGAFGWFGTIGYFAATGRFRIFYEVNFLFNSYYGSLTLSNFLPRVIFTMGWQHLRLVQCFHPMALVFALGLLLDLRSNRRNWMLLLAFLVSAIVEVSMPGRAYGHYYQLLLVPLCIGSGWTVSGFNRNIFDRKRKLSLAILIFLFAWLFVAEVPSYFLHPEEWAKRKYRWLDFPEIRKCAREFNAKLGEDEYLFQWGESTGLYYYGKAHLPGGIGYVSFLQYGPMKDRLSEQLKRHLIATPPEVVAIDRRRAFFGIVPQWILENYVPLDNYEQRWKLLFFARPQSRFAKQYGVKGGQEPQWIDVTNRLVPFDTVRKGNIFSFSKGDARVQLPLPEEKFVYAVELVYAVEDMNELESGLAARVRWTSRDGVLKQQKVILEPGPQLKRYVIWVWDFASSIDFLPHDKESNLVIESAKVIARVE